MKKLTISLIFLVLSLSISASSIEKCQESLMNKILNTSEVLDYNERWKAKNSAAVESMAILENANLIEKDAVLYKTLEDFTKYICSFAHN